MIKVKKKRITFSKDLDVKFSGKQIKETEKEITLEGEDEESYLKIYNPFHRVAKLILYEDNTWVDADSMNKIGDLDLSELGLEKFDLKYHYEKSHDHQPQQTHHLSILIAY